MIYFVRNLAKFFLAQPFYLLIIRLGLGVTGMTALPSSACCYDPPDYDGTSDQAAPPPADQPGEASQNSAAALEMTEEKMAALGLPGFGPSFSVSCENHGGDGMVAVAQWDAGAGKWSIVSDFQASDMSVIQPLIDEDSGAFAAENNLSPNCN